MSGGLRNKRPARFVTVEESARRRKRAGTVTCPFSFTWLCDATSDR